jgi:hypothetical protein
VTERARISAESETLEVVRRHPATEAVFRRRFREVETWLTQGNSVRDCCIIEGVSLEPLLRELEAAARSAGGSGR